MRKTAGPSALLNLWLPVIVWAALIFFLSSIPHLKTNLSFDFLLRKIAHVTEYFVLAALLYRAFDGTFDLGSLLLAVYPAGSAVLYAMSDELHQSFVAGRHGCLQDVLIDSIGVLVFYAVIGFIGVRYPDLVRAKKNPR